jgi:hypothetical protein
MNWKSLYFGHVARQEIQNYVKDPEWQALRIALKGSTLKHKYTSLSAWLKVNNNSRAAQVQVTNYVTALSRGGLIKPIDYLGG